MPIELLFPFNCLVKSYQPVLISFPGFANLKYPLPPNIDDLVVYGAFDHLDKTLTKDNYKERLHLLLHVEEFERRKELQK